jgi:opacity protein-like surface antigen
MKKQMKTYILAALILMVTAAYPVMAYDNYNYLEFNIGSYTHSGQIDAIGDMVDLNPAVDADEVYDGSAGFRLAMGFVNYQNNLEIGFEAIFNNFTDYYEEQIGETTFETDVDVTFFNIYGNYNFLFMPEEVFSPYAGGGAELLITTFSASGYDDESTVDIVPFIDLGADVHIDYNWAFNIEYRYHISTADRVPDINSLLVGIKYKFE